MPRLITGLHGIARSLVRVFRTADLHATAPPLLATARAGGCPC
ncbi:hypothetical protein ABZ802_26885 [Streptomyces sp. NPDC047737]